MYLLLCAWELVAARSPLRRACARLRHLSRSPPHRPTCPPHSAARAVNFADGPFSVFLVKKKEWPSPRVLESAVASGRPAKSRRSLPSTSPALCVPSAARWDPRPPATPAASCTGDSPRTTSRPSTPLCPRLGSSEDRRLSRPTSPLPPRYVPVSFHAVLGREHTLRTFLSVFGERKREAAGNCNCGHRRAAGWHSV